MVQAVLEPGAAIHDGAGDVVTDNRIAQMLHTLQTAPGISMTIAQRLQTHTIYVPDQSLMQLHMPIAPMIDHTLLKADATPAQIEQLCAEAQAYRFASVCVNPAYIPLCVQLLRDSSVMICTVIGFPLGATTTATKVYETRQALTDGAHEVDMVLAVGRLKAGDYAYVLDDLTQVVEIAHAEGATCKVIIETALLNDDEKIAACLLVWSVRADYVKTSTGFASGGATADDVALIARIVGPSVGVKASGGIRTLADAYALIMAGATRIGSSAGVQMVQEANGINASP